jgi:hypothetical protein
MEDESAGTERMAFNSSSISFYIASVPSPFSLARRKSKSLALDMILHSSKSALYVYWTSADTSFIILYNLLWISLMISLSLVMRASDSVRQARSSLALLSAF